MTQVSTIFRLDLDQSWTAFPGDPTPGALTTFSIVHHFGNGPNDPLMGRNPGAALIRSADNKLYGTTHDGTIFSLGNDGSFSELTRQPIPPEAPLIIGSDGALYGTSGSFDAPSTIFRVSLGSALIPAPSPGTTPGEPLPPINPTPPWRFRCDITMWGNVGVANRWCFIDPVVTHGYRYELDGVGASPFQERVDPDGFCPAVTPTSFLSFPDGVNR